MKTIQLIDACKKIGSGATPRGGNESYKLIGISLIRSQNVYNDGFKRDGLAFIDDEQAKELENVTVEPDDVLLNITGDSVARCCQVPDSILPARVNQHVAIIRPKADELDARYLRYHLIMPTTQDYLRALASAGATRPALTKGMIESLEVPTHPLPEQRAIAGILGALDDKIELNRRMNATLESMARAVFRQWFVENEEVGKWEVRKLSGICSTQYGYTASASDKNIGPKFLRITDMNKEPWIDWVNVPYCEIGKDELRKYKLEIGDILVSRMADPGKAGIVEEEVNAIFASYLVRLKFKDLAWAYFGYYFLRSDRYLEYSNGAKSGSVQSGMNARVITDLDISIPPDEKVMSFFETIKPFRNMIVANLKESRTLASLRDGLLPKLMRGEVRVRDVEAEFIAAKRSPGEEARAEAYRRHLRPNDRYRRR